jgi:uncharacterized membrane protein
MGFADYLILFSLGIIAPLNGILFWSSSKPKKNIVLGVTFPTEALSDRTINLIVKRFRINLIIAEVFLLFALLMIFVLAEYFSVRLTLALVWMIAAIVLPIFLFAKANTELKELKLEEGYRSPLQNLRVVDLKTRQNFERPRSVKWFLPPLIVSLLPVVLAKFILPKEIVRDFSIMCSMFSFMIILSMLLYPLIFRQRMDILGYESEKNAELSRIRLQGWTTVWFGIAWLSAPLGLLFMFFYKSETAFLIILCVYMAAMLVLAILVEMGVRSRQEKITLAMGEDYVDEDVNWIYGLFYHNPRDRHVLINDRVGMNMSVNMANFWGKVIMGATVLILLAMPFFGVYLIKQELSPRAAGFDDVSVSFKHVSERFNINYEDILELELLEELPRSMRVYGTGMDELLEGKFTVEGIGRATLSLNPQIPPYIMIKTEDKIEIFNLMSSEDTRGFFERMERAYLEFKTQSAKKAA